jgi:hypothetical protein
MGGLLGPVRLRCAGLYERAVTRTLPVTVSVTGELLDNAVGEMAPPGRRGFRGWGQCDHCAIRNLASRRTQRGRCKEIRVHERQAIGEPDLDELDLCRPCARCGERVGPAVRADSALIGRGVRAARATPLRVLTCCGFVHLVGVAIDQRGDVRGTVCGLSELLVSIDPPLPEIRVGEQTPVPWIIECGA